MRKKDPNATAIEGGPQAVRQEFDGASSKVSDFIFDGDIDPAPPRMLVKGVAPFDGIVFIGGQSGAGKTFVAVDFAHSLSTGSPFFGKAVKEVVGVVIVASEGQGMIAARVEAVRLTKSPNKRRLPIAWLANVPAFKSDTDIKGIAIRLRAADEHFRAVYGVRLGAVIIDTVAATFELEDEDDNSEAARTIRNMRRLGRATGALIVPVHHYGKAATTGLRGGSGWRAGADVVISVLADRNDLTGVVKDREVALSKVRDGIEGPLAPFSLRFIQLGVDEDEEAYGACVVEPVLGFAAQMAAKAATASKESRALRGFRDAFAEAIENSGANIQVMGNGPVVRAVKVQDVRAEFNRRYATGEGDARTRADSARKAFKRVLERLAGQYATQIDGDEEWIWAVAQASADTADRRDKSEMSGVSAHRSTDADTADGQDTPL